MAANYSGPSLLNKWLHDTARRNMISGFAVFDVNPDSVVNDPTTYGYATGFALAIAIVLLLGLFMIHCGITCQKFCEDCCCRTRKEYKKYHNGQYRAVFIGFFTVMAAVTLTGIIAQAVLTYRFNAGGHELINDRWDAALDYSNNGIIESKGLVASFRSDNVSIHEALSYSACLANATRLTAELQAESDNIAGVIVTGDGVITQTNDFNLTQYQKYVDDGHRYLDLPYPWQFVLAAAYAFGLGLLVLSLFIKGRPRDCLQGTVNLLSMFTFAVVFVGIVGWAASIAVSDGCVRPYDYILKVAPSGGTIGDTLPEYLWCTHPGTGGPINDNLDTITSQLGNLSRTAADFSAFARSNCTEAIGTSDRLTAAVNATYVSLNTTRAAVSCVKPQRLTTATLNEVCHTWLEQMLFLAWSYLIVPVFLFITAILASRPCTTYGQKARYRNVQRRRDSSSRSSSDNDDDNASNSEPNSPADSNNSSSSPSTPESLSDKDE